MAVLQEFKCPSCNGALEFDGTVQKMKCPYCGSEFEMDTIQPPQEGTDEMPQENMTWDTAAGGEWQVKPMACGSIPAIPAAVRLWRMPPPAPRSAPTAAIPL